MAVYINRSQAIAERLVKLRDYLYANASPTHAVKIADILTYLANEGHEVEIKTVYSDLKTLETHFGLDLQYDARQRGYLLKNPPFEPYELRSIVNSIQAAKFITQQEADRLTNKITRLADKYTRPSLNRKTLVYNRVGAINEELMKGLDTIYEAIAQDRKIRYKYFHYSGDRNNPKYYVEIDGSRIIVTSPYVVAWNGEQHIVLAVRRINGQDHAYFLWLEKMEQIEILGDRREGASTAERFIKNGFGNWKQDNSTLDTIKLKVNRTYISAVIEKFGLDTMVAPLDEQFVTATIKEDLTPELYIWTTNFSPRIEIIFPLDAENRFQAYFAELARGESAIPPFFFDEDELDGDNIDDDDELMECLLGKLLEE